MYRYTLFIILFLLNLNFTKAQFNVPNNFYILNPQTVNPAYSGLEHKMSIYLNSRIQWLGVRDAPELYNIGIQGQISKSFGYGVTFNNFNTGIFSQNTFSASASYNLVIAEKQKLSFGVSAGTINSNVSWITDEMLDYDDQALSNFYFDDRFFKIGFGLNYNFNEVLNLDIVIPEIYSQESNKYWQNFLIHTNYKFELKNSSNRIEISPNVTYRYYQADYHALDLGVKMKMKDIVTLMSGFRTNPGMYYMGLALSREKFMIAYIYEIDQTPMATFSKGTHEISFNFHFK